jgi:response regulator of citrate/malate metabolism
MSRKEYSVLLVEDDPGDRELFKEYLSALPEISVHLDFCDRLDSLFERLRNSTFDLIFLDLGLPDSKGIETLKKCIEKGMKTPIIVLTGMNDIELGSDAVRLGAQDYLIKNDINSDIIAKTMLYAIERNAKQKEINDLNDVLQLLNKILRHDLSNYLHFISGSLTLHKVRNDEKSIENAEFYLQRSYEVIDNMRNLESVLLDQTSAIEVEISKVLKELVNKFPIEIQIEGTCKMEIIPEPLFHSHRTSFHRNLPDP